MKKELIQDVQEWFHEKGIINKSNPLKQLWKTQEEVTETRDAIVRYFMADDDSDEQAKLWHEIKDGIGDTAVTLIGVCMMEELDFMALYETFSFEPQNAITQPSFDGALENLQSHLSGARDAIIKCDHWMREHDIGCMIWDLGELCHLFGITLEECLQQAYDVISERTGRMENGIFVKDAI